MGHWYVYTVRNADPAVLEVIRRDVPGVTLARKGNEVWAPTNAAWLVEPVLIQHGWLTSTRMQELRTGVQPFVPGDLPALREQIKARLEAPGILREGIAEWLFPHQVQGVVDLAARDGALALYGCGLGKTVTSIVWSVLHQGLTVVTTPASVRRQFGREIDRLLPSESFVLTPNEDCSIGRVKKAIANGCRHIVVGVETLPRYIDMLVELKPTTWVADELHKLKSRKRYTAAINEHNKLEFTKRDNIVAAAHTLSRVAIRRLGLTATFIANRLEDAWGQLDLIEPGQWGPFWREPEEEQPYGFSVRYCSAKKGLWGGVDAKGTSHIDEFVQRLSFVAHMVDAADVRADLPALRREIVRVGVEEQCKATGFTEEMRRALKAGPAAIREVLLAEAAARKRKWVFERIEPAVDDGQKIVILTGRHRDCDKLALELSERFAGRAKVIAASGTLSPAQREAAKEAYLSTSGAVILVGTRDAWSTGIDGLQLGTSLVLILMLPWRLSDLEQVEGRFNRPGQTTPVTIVYPICSSSYDEKVAIFLYDKLPAVVATAATPFAEEFKESLRQSDQATLDTIVEKITNGVDPLKDFWQD